MKSYGIFHGCFLMGLLFAMIQCAGLRDTPTVEHAPAMSGNTYDGEILYRQTKVKVKPFYHQFVQKGGYSVMLYDVPYDDLSFYKNEKPKTGGNRIFVYFDTDKDRQGAEYCLFVYKDQWTFRYAKPSEGYFNVLQEGKTQVVERNGKPALKMDVNLEGLKGGIRKVWNFHM